MKRSGIVALLVSGVVIFSAAAVSIYAQDAGPAQGKCPFAEKKECMHQRFYAKLGLTDQQKKAWEENKAAQWKQMKALFNSMKEKRELLKQEFGKDKLDMKKINQINGDLKKLAAQKIDLKLQRTLAAQKILTPEQFKQFIAKKHGYRDHHSYGIMSNKSSLTATPDGGVIVMKGHSLCKYDKDLNLVKEIKTTRTKAGCKDKDKEPAQPQGEDR